MAKNANMRVFYYINFMYMKLACSRTPAGTSASRRRRRAHKDYVANERKATPIRNNVRTCHRRIIPSLGRFGLSSPRHSPFLRAQEGSPPSPSSPNPQILTSIQIPPLLLLLPLRYGEPALFPSICHQGLCGE